MQPMCIGCGERAATEADNLCTLCALAGSEWSGLWAAVLTLDGRSATTPEQAREVLAAVGWEDTTFEPELPEHGGWLLELSPEQARLLLSQGHLCQVGGRGRVEIELP